MYQKLVNVLSAIKDVLGGKLLENNKNVLDFYLELQNTQISPKYQKTRRSNNSTKFQQCSFKFLGSKHNLETFQAKKLSVVVVALPKGRGSILRL